MAKRKIIQHGETTEASTKKEFQWHGIMPILVAWLHSEVIQKWYNNIYGELRAKDFWENSPNSMNHGIKSGKIFQKNNHSEFSLFNHVSIAWNHESYNIGRQIDGYQSSPVEELRTFLLIQLIRRDLLAKCTMRSRISITTKNYEIPI